MNYLLAKILLIGAQTHLYAGVHFVLLGVELFEIEGLAPHTVTRLIGGLLLILGCVIWYSSVALEHEKNVFILAILLLLIGVGSLVFWIIMRMQEEVSNTLMTLTTIGFVVAIAEIAGAMLLFQMPDTLEEEEE